MRMRIVNLHTLLRRISTIFIELQTLNKAIYQQKSSVKYRINELNHEFFVCFFVVVDQNKLYLVISLAV